MKNQNNKKVFEITVKRCIGLRRADVQFNSAAFNPRLMQPFFSFDFYTWEYQSAVSDGQNPIFEMTQRYEVDYTQELVDYMQNQFLKIDFIDESVALNNDQEISDYIGSARFPLRLVEDQQKTHVIPIINQKNMTMGQVELQLCFFNQGS